MLIACILQRGVSPIELYRRMRIKNGDFTDGQARENYVRNCLYYVKLFFYFNL